MFCIDNLATHLASLEQAAHLYVGYSGGLDSHVLLHAISKLVPADKITAVHINHHLSDCANSWQEHCEKVAGQLGVEIQSFDVTIDRSQASVEQTARDCRYQVFSSLLQQGDLLLLAHHADDQAETILYRLLRSSGPKGLAGMPVRRALGQGHLLRPLLTLPRSDLYVYAMKHQLTWVEDDSNSDTSFDRNFLRHHVLPVLSERWPDTISRLAKTAYLCGLSEELGNELASMDFRTLIEKKERLGFSVDLRRFKKLSPLRRQNTVRFWLQRHHFKMPPLGTLQRIDHDLIDARHDASPILSLGDCELRRFNGRIFLLKPLSQFNLAAESLAWALNNSLTIDGVGELFCMSPSSETVQVTFRGGGERCHPKGRGHSQTLKKLFQECGLEPWLRDRVPLIFQGEQLVAVAGLFSCEGFDMDIEFSWFD